MIDDNLPMSPTAGSLINVYDQNFNGLGTTIELFNKQFEDERITRSKGKEVLNFSALSTSNIYQYLQTENIIEFGGRWFRIKYAEDDSSTKGLTHYDCYALWYELAEGTPTPLKEVGSTIGEVANTILEPFGKWVELVIPDYLKNRSVNSITLQENSALYKLRYLAKRFNLELTFGYREVIENELRFVKTVVFLQQYTESKIEFPLVVEENLKHIARTEDSRNLVTAYKISGKSENDEEEFTFAEINGGSDYLVDTSWFTSRGMRPRIIPKAKKDDRFTIKQNMLDSARSYLDIYAKPLVSYEASAILYEEIPNLHQSQLVIDDTYSIVEWRKVSSRKLNYDDLTASIIVFDDPRQDLMDLLNDDGDGALSPTEESDSRTIIRYANDAMGNGFNDTSGAYIGVLVTKKKVNELGPQDFSWHKIKGEEGPQGPPGRDGVDGIAGKDGVGIIETQVSYYLSTSGTTKPQTGWTDDVPTLVKGRYLWTRTIWTYSDGQRETSYQATYIGQDGNTGRDGLPGKDGVGITSTIISYARSPSGTSAPTSGWTSEVPSVPAGEFLWTKTIWNYSDSTSETGYSVAKMGTNGQTPYVHWAYADNADGTGLTLTDNGQRYIGHYSDYTQADSTDRTKYRWADRWAKIDIGIDNLLVNTTSLENNMYKSTVNTSDKYNGGTVAKGIAPSGGYRDIFRQRMKIAPIGNVFIGSFYAKSTLNGHKIDCYFFSPNRTIKTMSNDGYTRSFSTGSDGQTTISLSTEWKRYWIVWTIRDATSEAENVPMEVIFCRNKDAVNEVSIALPALYIGNVNKEHSLAPEDIQAQINSKADQALTDQQLNMLIEKAQLMQTELEAKVAMETLSDIERAYNAYVEANYKAVAKSEADLIEAGRRVDAMVETLGGLSKTKKFIDTYIKEADEGLIIGKTDASSTIKVSSDRISMFSAGKEVMYISQGVINIDNGIFTQSIQVGRFRLEQHAVNLDMNVIRYIG